MTDQDRAREQAIELMAQAPVMDDVFGWKRTTGPDWTKEDIARLLLDALREAHYHEPHAECNGSGEIRVPSSEAGTDQPFLIACDDCAGTGMVDTGTRLTTALGATKVGTSWPIDPWWDSENPNQAGTSQGYRTRWNVFVEVPYTESESTP